MGDSDDEYDRRRARDKFRRERSDYNDRRRDRDERSSRRDEWSDRRREPSWENRRRGDYREFDRGRRDSSGRHHEMSPPMKRIRRDWDEPYHGTGDYSVPYGGVPAHHSAWPHPDVQQLQAPQQDTRPQRQDVDQQPQLPQTSHAPAMMTFKQFLNAQDDNISDEEAFKKYQEYKLEFRKTQMSDFFQQHKEEEWFRTKYHPKEAALRQKEYKKSLKRRLSVFLNLLKSGKADSLSLDIDNSEAIVKLLDAVVIKLEGGTDSDLAVLDCPPTPPPERRRSSSNPLMSPHGDDMTDLSAEGKKEGTTDLSTEPAALQTGKDIKNDNIAEAGPVSPSAVPLPSAPPPASVKAASKKKENGGVKVMSVANPTPEQQKLQQQAQQYYHQQQLYYQQQYYGNYDAQQKQQQDQYSKEYLQNQQQLPQTSQPNKDQSAQHQATKKEDDKKKKRKRRHREPYYYDAIDDDESESESESDSEPEPAPPGEEMSPMETGKEDELLPPGLEAEAPVVEENLLPPGVDDPKTCPVETSVQLPTSSSGAEKQSMSSTEEKPDSCEPSVDSSQPETSTTSNGAKTEEGSLAVVESSIKPEMSDDTAADSTQDPHTKESKQTFQAETSSIEQAESSSSLPEKDADQVGSTDNGIIGVKRDEDVEMLPESSSSEAQGKEVLPMEAEPSTASPVQAEPVEQMAPQVDLAKVEKTVKDSNKISEKREVVEETSPIKESSKNDKENAVEEKEKDTTEDGEEVEEIDGDEGKQLSITAGPRALHKTFSLFMRSVPPNISKADIAAVCKRFAGYLRVALSDPSPDRKFFRRGWITFDRSVNIKEICWDLNNIRVKDVELSPVVNRDLSRRVRAVAGAATAKQAIRDDIKLAARLIRVLDRRSTLYEKESKEETEAREKAEKEAAERTEEGEECEAKPVDDSEIPNLPSENPILASLSEDATEEEEGEEMELMGTSSPHQGEPGEKPEVDLSRDNSLLRVLDRLILYLRVVHSLDYYNGSDYPYEDEMPNRCGIIHVRGVIPDKCTLTEVQEWQKNLNQKLEPFLQEKELLKDDEVVQLGKKDPEAETNKFVEANTQELAKDKWLCPLSGKKFRGPDFVRKHIFNKHMDKVDAVRMEAEFFNSYLADPKRPQVPEGPSPQRPSGNHVGQMYGHQGAQSMMGWAPRPQMMMYGPRGPYTPPTYGGYGHEMYGRGHTFPPKPRRFGYGGGRNKPSDRGGFHRDPRQIVQYKDLDAPDDADGF